MVWKWKAQQFFTPFSLSTVTVRAGAQHVLEVFEYLLLLSAFWAGYVKTDSEILWVCSVLIGTAILIYAQSFLPQSISYPSDQRREWLYNIAMSLATFALGGLAIAISAKVISDLILIAIS